MADLEAPRLLVHGVTGWNKARTIMDAPAVHPSGQLSSSRRQRWVAAHDTMA
jgi:hypothetical protein